MYGLNECQNLDSVFGKRKYFGQSPRLWSGGERVLGFHLMIPILDGPFLQELSSFQLIKCGKDNGKSLPWLGYIIWQGDGILHMQLQSLISRV